MGEASKDDVHSGGGGDEIIVADHVPAVKDIVSCGGGFDRVLADFFWNLWTLRFDDENRCAEFVEWFMVRPRG